MTTPAHRKQQAPRRSAGGNPPAKDPRVLPSDPFPEASAPSRPSASPGDASVEADAEKAPAKKAEPKIASGAGSAAGGSKT